MQHSSSAKHKLAITVLLMILFALPFALQWRAVRSFDSAALLAGGAVIGNSAFSGQQAQPSTNNVAGISNVSGSSFTGALAR